VKDMQKTIIFHEDKMLNLSLEKTWALLAETNDLNQYVGLFPVQFTSFTEEKDLLIRHSEATAFGFVKTTWIENVFEWVRNHFYTIERVYSKGPILRTIWKVSIAKKSENRTIITLHGEFTVRNVLGKMAINRIIIPQLRKTFDYAEAFSLDASSRPRNDKMNKSILANEGRLTMLAVKLREQFIEEKMIERLLETILSASDADVTSMKPYSWAENNGFNRRLTVELFLIATKVGLLDQEWSMMCPNCRVPKGRTNTMKQLDNTVHCDLCGINYEIDFDRYIEMRFSVNSSVREAYQELYCVNGPLNSPHVLAQFRIPANEVKEIKLPLWNQELRWRVLRKNHTVDINEEEIATRAELNFTKDGFRQKTVPASKTIFIQNETDGEIVLVLEEVERDKFALTAREATSYQLFRDLFATDVLSSNQQISMGQLTILFTDLKGSTQLYESIGDAPAYSNVKKHFDYLMNHIRENDGAIVKTIGDSVMAVFTKEGNALKSSIAIQQNIAVLNEKLTHPVQIRIGFHAGPVIAVNANEILDYFGRTVNLAARIQQESMGSDIVFSENLYDELRQQAGYDELLSSLQIERFSRHLQGLNKDTKLLRINVAEKYIDQRIMV